MNNHWIEDAEVNRFFTFKGEKEMDVTEEVLASWKKGYKNINSYDWCIEFKESKKPIGAINVVGGNKGKEYIKIEYCLSRKYFGKDDIIEDFKVILDYLVKEVEENRIKISQKTRNLTYGNLTLSSGIIY